MDESAVKKIVESNIKRLVKKLGLENWDITLKYESLDGDDLARCLPNIEYRLAVIRIDPAQMDDKAHILHVMLHELIHCITCTFVTYRLAVARLIDIERGHDAVNVIYDRADEEITTAFCRILERAESEKKNL